MTFLVSLHGFNELTARGLGRLIKRGPADLVDELGTVDWGGIPIRDIAEHAATPLLADLRLRRKTARGDLHVPVELLADEIVDEHRYLLPSAVRVAEHILILACETTEELHTHDPLWEFLRHCRNAAAHGGRFHFLHREPRRPATWRGLAITAELERTPLLDGPASAGLPEIEPGLLAVGDPIRLLWDLEQMPTPVAAST